MQIFISNTFFYAVIFSNTLRIFNRKLLFKIPIQERIIHPGLNRVGQSSTKNTKGGNVRFLLVRALLVFFFFFFFLPDYALNYCRFGLNLGLIITKPSESADVTMREPGNKGWNESRNGRGIE